MSAGDNKKMVRQFYDEVINKGNLRAIDKLLAENFVDHSLVPGLPHGVEGVKQSFTMLRKGFPDARVTIKDLIVEGDKVVTRATMHGTNKGEFMGTPATGKKVTVEVIDVFRLSRGKAVEHWGLWDAMGMMQQLGAVPPPAQQRK